MKLKLSPLPKRPEDAVAPKSLNSEGEEQANAEQKEESSTQGDVKQPNLLRQSQNLRAVFRRIDTLRQGWRTGQRFSDSDI